MSHQRSGNLLCKFRSSIGIVTAISILSYELGAMNPVHAQVQQGLPPLIKPDYSFSNPDVRKAEDKSIERDAYGRPVKSNNGSKNGREETLGTNSTNDLNGHNNLSKKDQKNTSSYDNKDTKNNQNASINSNKKSNGNNNNNKDNDNKNAKDTDKNKPLSEVGVRCFNCGTIIAVTESRKRAKPIWMSSSDPNEASASEQSAKNVEKADNKPSDEFQKSSSNPVAVSGSLSRPNTGITLQRKLGFETTVRMEDGTLKTIVTALQPAYNVGAKVRVIGNSLSPR
jgi:hypothetical protein